MPLRRYLVVALAFTSLPTFARDVTVFDVRRPLAMENGENVPKDYYINAGENDGLKRGMIVTVNRRQSLYDQYQNKSPGDLVVRVGQLHIIQAQGDVSVARIETIHSRENLPTLEFDAIMVGDKIDLGSAKMAPEKTASLEEAIPGPIQVQIQAVPTPTAPKPDTAPVPAGAKDISSVAPQAPLTAGSPM